MAHETVMCRNCGHFVTALESDGFLIPTADECSQCGGREFKDIHTDHVVRTDKGASDVSE